MHCRAVSGVTRLFEWPLYNIEAFQNNGECIEVNKSKFVGVEWNEKSELVIYIIRGDIHT